MNPGRWEFYTRIAEVCDTSRRHGADFAKSHLSAEEQGHAAALLAYHLRQAENLARTLAGDRPEVPHA